MLDALRGFLDSPDHPHTPSLRIDAARWNDFCLDLDVAVTDFNYEATWSVWTIRCEGVREFQLLQRFGESLEVHESTHAAVRQHTDPWRALFFKGKPRDVPGLIGQLRLVHERLAEDYIPFDRYLNVECPLIELLSGGNGKLAEGPRFIVEEYAEVLRRGSIAVSLGNEQPARTWNGVEWVSADGPLSMVTMGSNCVVAQNFSDQRKDGLNGRADR